MRTHVAGAYNRAVSIRPGHVFRRTDGEPAADLTEHRITHRGIELDLHRLAVVAAEFTSAPKTQSDARWAALGDYLTALSLTTSSHLRVDTGCLANLLTAVTDLPTTPRADGSLRLLRLLAEAQDTVSTSGEPCDDSTGERLAAVLTEAAQISCSLFGRQERVLFPLILEYVRAADYRWVQEQFRAELPPGLLAFVVPWTMRHATAEEVPALNDPTLCVTRRIFGRRFTIVESQLFA